MRALTVRQPWAWAIIYGAKDVENRAQTWGYRGPLAIHAGVAWSVEGGDDQRVRDAAARIGFRLDYDRPLMGAIIGVANLVDVHRAAKGCCASEWADASYNGSRGTHLVLADPQPLRDPVRAKGILGLWQLPPHVERAVREQLPTSAVLP